jgi:hypothetical protein
MCNVESGLKLTGSLPDPPVEIVDKLKFDAEGRVLLDPCTDETARWAMWIYAAIIRDTNPMLAKQLDLAYEVMPTQCMRHIATELWRSAQERDRKDKR